jgi:hypothetical protein
MRTDRVAAGDGLTERERVRLLRLFDTLVTAIPKRPVSEVATELRAIRSARHAVARRGARKPAR